MKTARQIKSLYVSGDISFRAAHTALRAIGYSDVEAEDILLNFSREILHNLGRAARRPNRPPKFD